MKAKWFNVLKVVGVVAGGALVTDPTIQQAVQSVVPPPFNLLVGMGFGIAALYIKPPKKDETLPPPQPK